MPTKQKTAAKPPLDPHLKKITLSIPAPMLDQVDDLAKEKGLTRDAVIEQIMIASIAKYYASASNPPRPCPRGHIRPCERNRPPDPK